jgi:diguanylate cyclase (GGDEF)-like protein
MRASSFASRLKRSVTVKDWRWWQLPAVTRAYVAAPVLAAVVVIVMTAARTDWHVADAWKFLVLACCGAISVASTPRIMYRVSGVTADFSDIWVLPIAVLLPPVYAALAPVPFMIIMQVWVHRGVLHRSVFTGAAISFSYAVASIVFHLFPASFAGPAVGSGTHAFTWVVAVTLCSIIGGRLQHFLIAGAVKLSNPRVRIIDMERDRERLQGTFVELDLGVLITLAVALSPLLVFLAVPTVLLVRRFLVHPILVAQSRADAKTGLLNVSTWEHETQAELSRCARTRTPMAIALVDIDHFKLVNDTHGHLAGDRVLKAVADALRGQLRNYDKAGRFGGEEFVLLLAQASEDEACRIAERLRSYVARMEVPVNDVPGAPCVSLTISVGVTAMAAGQSRDLADMLAAADSALYQAKQTGRNRVCVARQIQRVELEIGIPDVAEAVDADRAAASLRPVTSL